MSEIPNQGEPTNQLLRIVSLLRTGPGGIIKRLIDQVTRWITGRPVWEFSEVTPQIYVGGQHFPKGWDEMQQKGIEAVVNMREKHLDDAKKGIQSENYLHLDTRDNTPPSLDDLHRGAQFIKEQVDAGRKVYIHCGVGVGRAPSQTAAYFIYEGMTPDEAIRKIKKVRPFVHLTYRQRLQLENFAAYLQQQKQT